MDACTEPRTLRYQVLGPLRVWRDGEELDVGPARRRVVLAVLLLHANKPVSREELVHSVWGTAAPRRAVPLLQQYAAELGRVLEPGRPAHDPSRLLNRTEAGYALTVPAGRLDLEAFTEQAERGRAARDAGNLSAAAEALYRALQLWRGALCEGLTAPLLDTERDRLAEHRLDVLEERVEVDLALGRHAVVMPELAELVRAHPLREKLRAQQVLAAHRSGQRAGAVAAHSRDRVPAEEPGGGPGSEPQHPERAVLTADPAPAPPTAPIPARARLPVPCLLPGDVAGFTGRTRQLTWLDRLTAPDAASTAAAVGLISGAPGVGKTALAVHWAHRVRPAFPDGQLYLNLRGYDPERPMTAGEALVRLLTALGLRGQDIPLDIDDRTARYRSELAGRRMLVVLDNATSAEQVRPLLPGTSACATLVTSRDTLPGLVALHGAHRLVLDVLPPDDTHALLRRLVGSRAQAEPQAAATLAHLCKRLPLALRLAAELAAARPHHSLADLATELGDRQRRLDLLEAGEDGAVGVRAVFSWSCQRLPGDAVRAFRLLALHPGSDWDAYATAALTGTGPDEARRLLDRLARAHLVQPTGPDRYTMHDLLRAYAAELAAGTETDTDRRAALTCLFDYYVAAAATAATALGRHPLDRNFRLFRSAPVATVPRVGDAGAAHSWLSAERANLVAVSAHAAGHGWPRQACELAAALGRYLIIGGHYVVALTIHAHARDAARRTGDRDGEAHALGNLAFVYWRQGHYEQAVTHHRQALRIVTQTGNRGGQAQVLVFLGLAHWRQGQYERAIADYGRASALFRQLGDRSAQAYALAFSGLVHWRQGHYGQAADHYRRALHLSQWSGSRDGRAYALALSGLVHWRQGRYEQAAARHRQALDLFGQIGDRAGQAYALAYLGLVRCRQGQYERAAGHHRQALDIFSDLGDRASQAGVLSHLGLVRCRQGRHEQAADHHRQALERSRQTGYRAIEIEALNGLGEALQASGRAAEARDRHAEALDLAARTGDRYEQARAHAGIAAAWRTAHRPQQARRHWEEAVTLYAGLGVPDADTVRAHLTALAREDAGPAAS